MQVPVVELPAVFLPPAALAHQAVQPAFDTALQAEIGRVDGQHQGGVEHAGIEPVRQDQFDAQRRAVGVGLLAPFVHPRKAVQASPGRFADGSRHAGRLQAVERGFQELVVFEGLAEPDEAQDLVGRGAYQARVVRLHDLGNGSYQNVSIPYRGNALLGGAFHADGDVPAAEVDRRRASRRRQREERKNYQILAVARQRAEQVELFPLLRSLPRRPRWAGHDDGRRRTDDQQPSR